MSLFIVILTCWSKMKHPVAFMTFGLAMVLCFLLMNAFFGDPGITYTVHEKSERLVVTSPGVNGSGPVRDGLGTGLDVRITGSAAYPCQVGDRLVLERPPDPQITYNRDGTYVTFVRDTTRPNYFVESVTFDPEGPVTTCRDVVGRVSQATVQMIADNQHPINRVTVHRDRVDGTGPGNIFNNYTAIPYDPNDIAGSMMAAVCHAMGTAGDRYRGGAPTGIPDLVRPGESYPIWGPILQSYQAALELPDARIINQCQDTRQHVGDTFQDTQTTHILLDDSRHPNEALALIFFLIGMCMMFFTFLTGYQLIGYVMERVRSARERGAM